MKNIMLTDLQADLFKMARLVMDEVQKNTITREKIEGHLCFNELAKTIVTNGALMARCADTLYGLPVASELPLIPPSPAEKPVIVDGKRRSLLSLPKTGRGGDA